MKYLEEYRDPAAARSLIAAIRQTVRRGKRTPWTIMEVCGGQTHGLLRYGIDEELRDCVELIHGPGCPVCVTGLDAINLAQQLAQQSNVLLCSFGDMLRVPGSCGSLLDVRANGGNVRGVYSPLDAVQLARQQPQTEVVFFAVGFETTAPATALAVLQAAALGLANFSMLVAHVRVQPAMQAVMQSPNCRINGFLAAGHVCTVMGYESYHAFCQQFGVPVVITGFEPIDLLQGILACVQQLESHTTRVENCYQRSVQLHGNRQAQDVVGQVYRVCDQTWRGLGKLPQGGLTLREEYAAFDANKRFAATSQPEPLESAICPSGQVLSGQIKPPECPHFGVDCTPLHPLGAPMVSTEGACAAYYRYRAPHTVPLNQELLR
jgi:hydrogenase expression/formation protein HypD